MRRPDASELAQRLGDQAEGVCRHYISNGRRNGRHWLAGDARNTPGRSLYVRLSGPARGRGAAGKWTDAATGEHGDLLDLIRHALGLADLAGAMNEARRFLGLPPGDAASGPAPRMAPVRSGSPEAARRLFALSQPVGGTIAEAYLRNRGLTALHDAASLRFHPSCLHRPDDDAAPEAWPALIASVTDREGWITGVQRTWLARDGSGKAPLGAPRRALGDLLGHAVRFGRADDAMAAGEGIETMLSIGGALPTLPMAAALSAGHLAALLFPGTLRRLYIARDNDKAGQGAEATLTGRARAAGIDVLTLRPVLKDFNDDLIARGPDELRSAIRIQIAPEDVARFLTVGD